MVAKSLTRIYEITPISMRNTSCVRLVRATNRSQALWHVANTAYKVEVANQEGLVELLGAGVTGIKVETANAPEEGTEHVRRPPIGDLSEQ